ncbi:MAG: hypothetical protein ABIP93_00060 [Gemmatimonadaceae bacterium]
MLPRKIGIGYRLAQVGAAAAALGGLVDALVPRLLPHHEAFLGVAAGAAPPATVTLVLLLLHTLGIALLAMGLGALALLAAWRAGAARWAALSSVLVVVLAEGMNAWAIGKVGSPIFIGPLVCVILVVVGVALELRRHA